MFPWTSYWTDSYFSGVSRLHHDVTAIWACSRYVIKMIKLYSNTLWFTITHNVGRARCCIIYRISRTWLIPKIPSWPHGKLRDNRHTRITNSIEVIHLAVHYMIIPINVSHYGQVICTGAFCVFFAWLSEVLTNENSHWLNSCSVIERDVAIVVQIRSEEFRRHQFK